MRMLSAFLYVLLFMTVSVVTSMGGPLVEARLFPVYSKFVVVSAENVPEGVLVVFRFTKWRNCDPQGIAWYMGNSSSGFNQLTVENQGPSSKLPRPLGTQRTSPFLVRGIPELDLRSEVFAEISNRCHSLWLVKTPIFP